jgi:MFS family permease
VPRRIPRNVYLLGLLSFFNDVTSDAIVPLLPAFLGTMGLGARFLGLMEGLADSLSNILKLYSGRLADRSGKSKALTVAGYGLSTFIRPFLAIPIPAVTIAVRLLDRVGKGIRTAPRDRLITDIVEKKSWGEAFGIQRSMDHAGAILGPLIATWLLATYHLKYSTLFLIACAPSVLSIIFIPGLIKDAPFKPKKDKELASWKSLPPALKKYVVLIFLVAFCTPSELFLMMRIKDLGLAPALLPMAWLTMTVASFFSAYLGGRLADRWSLRRTMGIGWLIFSVVYLGFAFNAQASLVWPLMAGYGIQMGLVEPAERAYPAAVVPDSMRATAIGWFYFAYGMGLLPASLIFGVIWKYAGFRPAFLINAGLTLATVFLLFFLPSDKAAPLKSH